MALPGLISKIVSGGQSGVDRAALDAALSLDIRCGGWVPRGRRTEDGPLPSRYAVRETGSEAYEVRTRLNVRDSDGTLILTRGRPTGGTALTRAIARELERPSQLIDLGQSPDPQMVRDWIAEQRIRVLNVAGPRESSNPGIYNQALQFLLAVLRSDDEN